MFGDLNQVSIIGNMASDIIVKALPNGNPVANFSVATNYRYKSGEEWKDAPEFHRVVLFGKQVDTLAKWAKKGTRVFIQGRLKTQSWEKDGVKHYRTETVVNTISLLARYEKNSEGNTAPQQEEINDLPF